MFTNFDCDCFWVADRDALVRTLSVAPEYLKNQASESGAVFDYRDWHVPLGRRFRALKLWFVIRHYGVEGLRHHVRRHVELAQQFKSWVEKSGRFELAAPVPLNLVCFRHVGGEEINRRLLERLNQSVQQNPIEATVMPPNAILVVFVEGVHGRSPAGFQHQQNRAA